MTHAAQDAPDCLAGDPRGPYDLLDRGSGGRQRLNLRIDRRARQRAFPLQPLGPRQCGGVDDGLWRQCLAQSGKLGTHNLQEGCGCILEQMPTVGDLDGLWRSAVGRGTVACPSVPADHFNLAVGPEPIGNGLALAIRQDIDHGAPLEMNDKASITTAAPLGEVVNADHARTSLGATPSASSTAKPVETTTSLSGSRRTANERRFGRTCDQMTLPSLTRRRARPDASASWVDFCRARPDQHRSLSEADLSIQRDYCDVSDRRLASDDQIVSARHSATRPSLKRLFGDSINAFKDQPTSVDVRRSNRWIAIRRQRSRFVLAINDKLAK